MFLIESIVSLFPVHDTTIYACLSHFYGAVSLYSKEGIASPFAFDGERERAEK